MPKLNNAEPKVSKKNFNVKLFKIFFIYNFFLLFLFFCFFFFFWVGFMVISYLKAYVLLPVFLLLLSFSFALAKDYL